MTTSTSTSIPGELLGLPQQRAALVALVGPPGSGKSTFATALAERTGQRVSVL